MSAVLWIVASVALVLAAWVRATGSAITRVPRADAHRDASEGKRGASVVAGLLDHRDVIAPAVAVFGSALLVLAAVAGTAVLVMDREASAALGYCLVVFVLVFVLGDLVPRQLGRRRPHLVAYRSAALLGIAARLGGWANDLVADAEADEDQEVGSLPEAEQEREMIHSILEFGETLVREVMTPRPDMVTVPPDATLAELVSITSDEGYSRIPVAIDGDVTGMVIVKDLLPMLADGRHDLRVTEVMRPVEFVPETKLASVLLGEMRAGKVHQMVVIDEYGDIAGLVTIEDLLEELVGEIADETDEEEIFIIELPDGGWDIDARVPVSELEDLAGLDLPDEEWDTVGGLILGLAERVPDEGERFSFGPLNLTVTRMQGRRVAGVRVVVSEPVDTETG
jgi:magnesium and cobalt exporter, CNNM family